MTVKVTVLRPVETVSCTEDGGLVVIFGHETDPVGIIEFDAEAEAELEAEAVPAVSPAAIDENARATVTFDKIIDDEVAAVGSAASLVADNLVSTYYISECKNLHVITLPAASVMV